LVVNTNVSKRDIKRRGAVFQVWEKEWEEVWVHGEVTCRVGIVRAEARCGQSLR
jgi:hypothetical protein